MAQLSNYVRSSATRFRTLSKVRAQRVRRERRQALAVVAKRIKSQGRRLPGGKASSKSQGSANAKRAKHKGKPPAKVNVWK